MPGEHHGDAVLVADLDRFFVADAAAGLDDGRDAGLAGVFDGVAAGEGEEGVGGEDGALRALAGVLEGVLRRPEAVWLAAADADGGAVLRENDRVRLDVLEARSRRSAGPPARRQWARVSS